MPTHHLNFRQTQTCFCVDDQCPGKTPWVLSTFWVLGWRSRGDPELFMLLKIPTPTMTCSHVNYDMILTVPVSTRHYALMFLTTTSHPSLLLPLSICKENNHRITDYLRLVWGHATHSCVSVCEHTPPHPRFLRLCIDKTRTSKRWGNRMFSQFLTVPFSQLGRNPPSLLKHLM